LTSVKSSEEGFRLTNSDEFRQLYQDIALIKPELALLIDKYRQRKDDLLDLHKKVRDASAVYEDLTDPLKYQYHQQYYPQAQTQSQQQYQQIQSKQKPQQLAQQSQFHANLSAQQSQHQQSLQPTHSFDQSYPPVNQFQAQSPEQAYEQSSTGANEPPPIPQTVSYPSQNSSNGSHAAPYPQY
jgi:signal transducing adaptor molecule